MATAEAGVGHWRRAGDRALETTTATTKNTPNDAWKKSMANELICPRLKHKYAGDGKTTRVERADDAST